MMNNMMRIITFMMILIFWTHGTQAQTGFGITGKVLNQEGRPLTKASVWLYVQGDVDTLKAVTNEQGVYRFTNLRKKKFALRVTYVGFKPFLNSYDYTQFSSEQRIADISMQPGDNTLENLTL
ncbi:MAG TPA: carboxypeptidase-like regulatory domain-containing protein, partial [Ferruginibacter sp.]|nr:carboxypeptidase-like regulatory domain-containing protein [Ferruginibacter sp.]